MEIRRFNLKLNGKKYWFITSKKYPEEAVEFIKEPKGDLKLRGSDFNKIAYKRLNKISREINKKKIFGEN